MNQHASHRLQAVAGAALVGLLFAGCTDPDPGPGVAGDALVRGDAPPSDGGASDAPRAAEIDGVLDPDGAADPDGGLTPDVPGCAACEFPAACVEGYCVAPVPGGCVPGETGPCYGPEQVMTCDATGTAFVPEDCPPSYGCFGDGECKPALCAPGQVFCEGLAATKACNEDGSGFTEPEPCPTGQYCTSGKCTATCMSDPKFGSYVGCAYWTVDLPNWPDPSITPTNPEDLPHALVISNPNEMDATITFEAPPGVEMNIVDNVVHGLQSRVFMMPVINTEGSGVALKAIRFESTRPILAHQFNPWKAIWSNDASLLQPEPFLGSEYVIMSWPTDPRGLIDFPGMPKMENVNGFFTVVAPYDDTEVTIQVRARVAAGPNIQAMEKMAVQTITLQRGEILNVEGEPATLFEECDLTGSTVDATKPVAVFAGHESAGIGDPSPAGAGSDSCCLDHLEEQMLPMHVLDKDYLAVKSKPRGSEPDIWRIQAAEAGVTVNTDPPVEGAVGVTLPNRGDWIQVWSAESFEIHATGKIQVGQYLIGGSATDAGTGDPSLMLAVPSARFRESYVLTVPPGYDTNWITVIQPIGGVVTTGAGPIPATEYQTFGSGQWEFAYIELPVGVQKLYGDLPFGLVAYGYNGAMSYGFTGGMN